MKGFMTKNSLFKQFYTLKLFSSIGISLLLLLLEYSRIVVHIDHDEFRKKSNELLKKMRNSLSHKDQKYIARYFRHLFIATKPEEDSNEFLLMKFRNFDRNSRSGRAERMFLTRAIYATACKIMDESG